MHSFKNDYSEGAHPRILQTLLETNLEQAEGYGEDQFSQQAAELIKAGLCSSDVDIHFLPGGTHTNLIAISAFLRPHEAAIAAGSGHILVHETGAIEATGHKILSIDTSDGKINPESIKNVLAEHTDEHMVKPRLVYISNSTELGTVYSKSELTELSGFCRENKLIFFMDGARLGSALCSGGNDVALSDLPTLFDAFYIGGTKNGALLGEALVICSDLLKEDFRYHIKQKGALLAKGRIMGIQFLELFRDDLYFQLARHANEMAALIRSEMQKAGLNFLVDSPSNQIFPILPEKMIKELQKKYSFQVWARVDEDHSAIRLVTSWATQKETVHDFIQDFQKVISMNER
jgi:threonine aldolase